MTSPKIEALKALALTVITALAALGVVTTDVPNVVAPIVGALGAVAGVFLIHRPQDVETNLANAAVAKTVQDVALHGDPALVDVPIGPADAKPSDQVVVPVAVTATNVPPEQL